MENGRPAAAHPSPSRWVEVAPSRFPGWVAAFGERHGALAVEPSAGQPGSGQPAAVITFRAADGAVAECHPPFPPAPAATASPARAAERIAAHAAAQREVGVLLVRLGGYAAGVFCGPAAGATPGAGGALSASGALGGALSASGALNGTDQLIASKVGARLVHGRSAAGGTSQHRFARRREKQAREALEAAADTAAAVLGPHAADLDAVVLGGDRRAMAGLSGDPRLRPLFALAVERFVTVPDPRLAVLREAPRRYRAIRIQLREP